MEDEEQMKLIKRIKADIRDPRSSEQTADNMVNEALIALQSNEDGTRNDNIEVIDIKEITKDSGIMVFLVLYNDKGLDIPNK